jgi:tetratricopeptide (TPR) repeat protein
MPATTDAASSTPLKFENFEVTILGAEPPEGGFNVVVRYANGTRMGAFHYEAVAPAVTVLQDALLAEHPQEAVIAANGALLFDSLFHGTLRDAWREQWALARQAGHGVRLCITTQDPQLVATPWEYLYDREQQLALSLGGHLSIVRSLPVGGGGSLPLHGALRVLVVIAGPSDYAPLHTEQEWSNLEAATAAAAIDLLRVEPTYPALQAALRQHAPHVIHFGGHGAFLADTGVAAGAQGALAFCREDGTASLVSAHTLATLLSGSNTLRLVYLNACEGAVTGTASAFAGVAQQLMQKGTPAVLAMQAPVYDDHALRFSQEFYRALADGYGVEQAIGEGRRRVKEVAEAWGVPTFYFRGVEPFAVTPLSAAEKAQRLWQKAQANPNPGGRKRQLQAILQLDPQHAEALAAQRKLDNADEAAQLYAAGEAYYQQQQWQAAYRNFEEAERLAPNFRQTRALLAEILGKLGGQTPHAAFDFHAQVEEYRPILNALQEGRLVPFLGWEVSQFGRPPLAAWVHGRSLPSSAEAARALAERLPRAPEPRHNAAAEDFTLLEASQYTSLIEGETALYERLSALYSGDHQPTILHRLLAELPGRLRAKGYPRDAARRYVICTIALDDLLERAFAEAGQPYHLFAFRHRSTDETGVVLPGHFVHVPPGGEPVAVRTPNDYSGHDGDTLPIVVKLSGRQLTAEPDSVLVTEDQYLEYLPAQEIGALLPATLLRQINRRNFLFFGYSLQPWHFRLLWQRMRYQKRRLHDRSWAVVAELSTIEREFWRSHDIVPIVAAPEGVVAYVNTWLERLEAAR